MPAPKSKARKRLEGTYRPDRDGSGISPAAQDGELGDPPACLMDAEREAWREIADQAPPDWLTKSDRLTVELTARLTAKTRAGLATAGEVATLKRLLGELGCNPAVRGTLALPEPPPDENLGGFEVLN